MKKALLTLLSLAVFSFSFAQEEVDSTQIQIAEIEAAMKYQTGVINLEPGSAKLTVPKGFKFLDKDQSMYVLSDLWGNPVDSSILGMLVPVNKGVLTDNTWAFSISYDPMGFVKDDDADDINYDDLLKEQQQEFKDVNPERIKQGYDPIEFIGWASAPFYDSDKKILHWAKELKFGKDSLHTLNYNLRVLGRKGIFMLNAIATVNQLPEVKASINNVISSVEFKEGSKYSDFNPDIDEVAAWTIGGLVAGKILAKVGLFALAAKFGKVILVAIAAGGGAIWKFIRGRRRKEDEIQEEKVEVAVAKLPANNEEPKI